MRGRRAFVLAVMLAPAALAAQPTAKQKQQASELVKQAIAKSQAGDHAQAVELYSDAYDIIPEALLLSNMGSEYQQMKKPVEALKFFCKYLDADENGNNATYVRAQARTLYIELGGVTHVEDDELCEPIVKPEPVKPPPPPPPDTRLEEKKPPPEPSPPPPPKAHGTSPLRYVGVAITGLGLAAVGGGVYYGLEAKKIDDEISNHPTDVPWGSDIKEKEARGRTYNTRAVALMAGGGSAVVLGLAVILLTGSSDSAPSETVTFAPIATPDSVGFAAAGRF